MHNIQVDRILTEARGLIYIKPDGSNTHGTSPTTNWQDYGEVIEWAKGQEWWQKFLEEEAIFFRGEDAVVGEHLTNPETGSRAIAEFIESEGV